MIVGWNSIITLADVIDLHAQGIAEHSHATLVVGKSAEECVEGRLGNAWMAEQYSNSDEDAVPGLCFSGYLLFYLVKDHCFSDGNKRVAWSASMAVLASIGLTVEATDDQAYDLVDGIARGQIKDGMDVVRWISAHLHAPDPSFLQ